MRELRESTFAVYVRESALGTWHSAVSIWHLAIESQEPKETSMAKC